MVTHHATIEPFHVYNEQVQVSMTQKVITYCRETLGYDHMMPKFPSIRFYDSLAPSKLHIQRCICMVQWTSPYALRKIIVSISLSQITRSACALHTGMLQ